VPHDEQRDVHSLDWRLSSMLRVDRGDPLAGLTAAGGWFFVGAD
jgi:hypothetical protein